MVIICHILYAYLFLYLSMYSCMRHVFGEDLSGVSLSKPTFISQKNTFLAYQLQFFYFLAASAVLYLLTVFSARIDNENRKQTQAYATLSSFIRCFKKLLILCTYLILLGNFSISIPKFLLNLAVSKPCNCSLCAYALPVCHGDCLCSIVSLNTFTVDDKFYILSKELTNSHSRIFKVLSKRLTLKYYSLEFPN